MNLLLEDVNLKLIEDAKEVFEDRKIVLGDGNLDSIVMLIGEAPGAEEEKEGRPFVGKAGKNLMKFLDSISVSREQVYISNVVKIRPFKVNPKSGRIVNRPPNKEELEFFKPYLEMEIKALKPEIIVTLGNVPLQAVLKSTDAVIGNYHGKIVMVDDTKVFPLYHPAAIIYNQSLASIYEQDVEELRKVIENR